MNNKTQQTTEQPDLAALARIYFGTEVKITAVYRRVQRGYAQQPNRIWQRYKKNDKGLLIGLRRLHDGTVRWYEDHSEWDRSGDPIPAWLVVCGPHVNPVYVPIDSLIIEPESFNDAVRNDPTMSQADKDYWLQICPYCGDDRTGKGSLMWEGRQFCNDDHFELWRAAVLAKRQEQ